MYGLHDYQRQRVQTFLERRPARSEPVDRIIHDPGLGRAGAAATHCLVEHAMDVLPRPGLGDTIMVVDDRGVAVTALERPADLAGVGVELLDHPPVALFPDTFRLSVAHTGYDVFPSGREFLMTSGPGPDHNKAYILVNWPEAMLTRGNR